MLHALTIAFSLFSAALAFGTVKPICTPTQFRNAALNLTLEYQDLISECNFLIARSLASISAVARVNIGVCPNNACCQMVTPLIDFNTIHYNACSWDVDWINQQPMTATINQCGDISVFAVSAEVNKGNTVLTRAYQVEFLWRPQCGATGCFPNCALELVDIKYATWNCTDWDASPRCVDCLVGL